MTRARVRMRYADRLAAALPWLRLFGALGVDATPAMLVGPEPE